jgi:hypothetical protein
VPSFGRNGKKRNPPRGSPESGRHTQLRNGAADPMGGRNMMSIALAPRAIAAVLVVLVTSAAIGPTAVAGSGKAPPEKPLPARLLLQPFDALAPAARLKLIEKNGGDKVFQAVVRDDVVGTVVVRGSLASAKNAHIYCRSAPRPRATPLSSSGSPTMVPR